MLVNTCTAQTEPTKGRTSWAAARGAKDAIGNTGNLVLVNSGFHTRNKLTENYSKFGHAPYRTFVSPVLGRNFFFKRISI